MARERGGEDRARDTYSLYKAKEKIEKGFGGRENQIFFILMMLCCISGSTTLNDQKQIMNWLSGSLQLGAFSFLPYPDVPF